MKINRDQLVEISVWGEIVSAVWPVERSYRIGADGVCRVLPGTGGICYSHQIGDSAISLKGDHVEPGVSIKASRADENSALNTFACVGNDAFVVTGSAKGQKGTVTGTHGGVEHVMVDFPRPVLEQLTIGDKIQIRSHGVGLELSSSSDVVVMSCDPRLIERWGLRIDTTNVTVPVTHRIPAGILGSGIASITAYRGDVDVQMFSPAIVKRYGLDTLRFGDLVALEDADHTLGRRHLEGAVTIGVVVHSRSDLSGHGPGVTTLLTSRTGKIKPVIDKNANIGNYFELGRWRKTLDLKAGKKKKK